MSQNLSKQVEKALKEISADMNFYRKRFKKNNSEADEIRYWLLSRDYYKIKCEIDNNSKNRELYQEAKENCEKLVPVGETYSMNRKG